MRKLITFLILTVSLTSCNSSAQEIEVVSDTLEYDIYGEPGPWIKFENKYYCYFKTDNSYFSSGSTHHFYIINSNGEIEKKVTVPNKLQTSYYDLFIKNDSIFTVEYYNQNTFYLDRQINEWVEVKKADDVMYEDDNYYVTSMDFGEWGGKTWFKEKSTNVQYELATTTPIINKLNEEYYLTTGRSIYKVVNPTELIKSENPYIYEKMVGQDGRNWDENNSLKGAKIIFADSSSQWDSKFSIATSFKKNDKLYHLYKDSISTKIGRIDKGKMLPVFEFQSELRPFRWFYNDRNRIQPDGNQSIQFRTENKSVNGLIEILPEKINVTYFNNSHKVPVFGTEQSKLWFTKTFYDYYSKLGNLKLSQIDSVERNLKATDLTQRHKIGISIKENLDLETPRIYRKIEDSTFVLLTQYYYTKKEKSIEIINFEWKENKLNKENIKSFFDDNNPNKQIFKERLTWITEYITSKFGKPISDEKDKSYRKTKWEIDGNIITISSRDLNIDLKIYRK